MRLIDADRLVKCFCAHCTSMGEDGVCNEGGECFDKKIIDYTPTVEAEPVRRRRFIKECTVDIITHKELFAQWICSECGSVFNTMEEPGYNYCPHCGARMEVENG